MDSRFFLLLLGFYLLMLQKIRKRDGRIVKFDSDKITKAIAGAGTATGEFNSEVARKLTLRVLDLAQPALNHQIPTVEEIQDTVEQVLFSSPYQKTAKAYILYREQHARLRETRDKMSVDLVDQYLSRRDWQVKENSNMTFSLQGLNNYLASEVSKIYWLRKIYSPEIRKAYEKGDFHIHDLGLLAIYCVGWDLQDLLLQGFRGVPGKTESTPAKHFKSALGQVVNFFYTLQGETAGAVAFSNFDTLLAPFIHYDHLSYKEVKQALQEFTFNMNVPTRVGFQCLSEDTKILSAEGWKSYDELQEGDIIYTFNTETGQLEKKATDSIFRRKYQGKMFNLRNRNQDQLISPRHRVVRQVFNIDKYKLEPIEDILKLKSPISIPVRGENANSDFPIDDHQLMFLAWTLSEGTIEKDGSHRVSIYQSPKAHPENYKEIIGLFDYFDFQYTENSQTSLGTCTQVRALPASSKIIHQWLGATSKKIPSFLFSLSKRQARIFLETYVKGDGWEEKYRKRIVTTSKEILEGLEAIAVLAGYNFGVRERKLGSDISRKPQYVLTLTEAKHDYIQKIREVDYEGVIWSVHTENETVVARRNGQVFITGNTPYTNITLDLNPSPVYKNQPVIIGGKLQKETYGDFQEEMNVFNKAFLEVMLAGDAKGRVFTFPIPTYNIDKAFDWENKTIDYLWAATAKYGLPYFANFMNSDMKPEEVRSMCCRLRLNLKELEKRGGGYFGSNPLTGSIGVVTVNLPRLAYLSRTEEDFLKGLEKLMVLAKNSLEIKRKLLERLTDLDLYPYSKFYLRDTKQRFDAYWKNHFSTIGLIGMNEATLNLLGKNLGEPEARKFALEVLDFMREKLIAFQEETGNNYNLEATPAEGTAYRLALKDKKEFPDIICANEKEYQKGAEPFYTNSTQLPVSYTDDVFEALDLQDEVQQKYTGGTVLHIFAGERVKDGEVVKKLVRKVCENYHLPYFTFSPTFSICPSHGYLPGNQPICPKCGAVTEVYSRPVGYLRPVNQWNKGKAEEFKERKTFKTE